MEYNKIIAVTGMPGLYELLSSKSDGAIVRSLDDKTTRFVASRSHNFSHLESIEVYTVRDNVNLVDVLKAMEASSAKLPDEKDNAALKAYFQKVYPDLDFGRVYSSDLKKMVKWFGVLKANDIEIKLSEPEEEPAEEAAPAESAVEEKPAPAKKAAKTAKESQPAAKVKEATPAKKEAPAEEKPKAKKAAPKKKAEAAEEKPKKTAAKKKK
ncbi:MAG TPA: DUF5606 domain-containing protein [Puia sp.]|jgi:hypothetical protein